LGSGFIGIGGFSGPSRSVAGSGVSPIKPQSSFQSFAVDIALAIKRTEATLYVLTISPEGFCLSDKLLKDSSSCPQGLCARMVGNGIRSFVINFPLKYISVANELTSVFDVVMSPNGKTLETVISEINAKGIITVELVAKNDIPFQDMPVPPLPNAEAGVAALLVGRVDASDAVDGEEKPLKEQLDEVFQSWRVIISPSLINLIDANRCNKEQARKALDIARNVRIDFFSWDGLGAKDASKFSRVLYHFTSVPTLLPVNSTVPTNHHSPF